MSDTNWVSPVNLHELAAALAEKRSDDFFICGGTDVLVARKSGKEIGGLIDLKHVPELRRIESENGFVFVGSAATYTDIQNSKSVQEQLPALAKCASMVGSAQIRNRGTIGGGVANASPASDIIPVLYCLQAIVVIIDQHEQITEMPFEEFALGIGKVNLATDQCILGFKIPVRDNMNTAYVKLGTRSMVTIAQMTATAVTVVEDHVIKSCRLVIGSIGAKPVLIPETTAFCIGRDPASLTEEEILKASEYYTQFIQETVPKQFDRDYKVVAIRGVFLDLFQELQKAN